ncbi:unnamed protein product [Boreogadus saida]
MHTILAELETGATGVTPNHGRTSRRKVNRAAPDRPHGQIAVKWNADGIDPLLPERTEHCPPLFPGSWSQSILSCFPHVGSPTTRLPAARNCGPVHLTSQAGRPTGKSPDRPDGHSASGQDHVCWPPAGPTRNPEPQLYRIVPNLPVPLLIGRDCPIFTRLLNPVPGPRPLRDPPRRPGRAVRPAYGARLASATPAETSEEDSGTEGDRPTPPGTPAHSTGGSHRAESVGPPLDTPDTLTATEQTGPPEGSESSHLNKFSDFFPTRSGGRTDRPGQFASAQLQDDALKGRVGAGSNRSNPEPRTDKPTESEPSRSRQAPWPNRREVERRRDRPPAPRENRTLSPSFPRLLESEYSFSFSPRGIPNHVGVF